MLKNNLLNLFKEYCKENGFEQNSRQIEIINQLNKFINPKKNILNYLINKTMGDLMHAEQDATIDTFKLNNFKFREILLNEINEEAMGTLMAVSIMETIAACIYFEVDPFDQPAVEQGKILTKKYLS